MATDGQARLDRT